MPANTPRGYTYPLYGDPANFPAQLQDFAQDVDLDVQAQVAATATALNAPSALVSESANQLIPGGAVQTTVTFSVEDYDNAAMANLGVNNERITFTSTGIYLLTCAVNFAPNGNAAVGGRRLAFTTLGVDMIRDSEAGSQNIDTQMSLTYLHQVTAIGQFVQVRVDHTSGAGVNIDSRTFAATKVAA